MIGAEKALNILAGPVQENSMNEFKLALSQISDDVWENALGIAPFVIGNLSCANASKEMFQNKFSIALEIVPFGLPDSVIIDFWSCISQMCIFCPDFRRKLPIATSIFPKCGSVETIKKLWYYKHYLLNYIQGLSEMEIEGLVRDIMKEQDNEMLVYVVPLLVERKPNVIDCLLENADNFIDVLSACLASYQCPKLEQKCLIRLCELMLSNRALQNTSLFVAFKCYLATHEKTAKLDGSAIDVIKSLDFLTSPVLKQLIGQTNLVPRVCSMPVKLASVLDKERKILMDLSEEFATLMKYNPCYLVCSLYILSASESIRSIKVLLDHYKKMVHYVIGSIKMKRVKSRCVETVCSLREILECQPTRVELEDFISEYSLSDTQLDTSTITFAEMAQPINPELLLVTNALAFEPIRDDNDFDEEEDDDQDEDEIDYEMLTFTYPGQLKL